MVVILVRCSNGACTLALQTRLAGLINDGLITAFLHNGRWIRTDRKPRRRAPLEAGKGPRRMEMLA